MTDRLALLREEMKALELDGLLIPHADAHQGEYLPPGAERLAWLTGFTGSAGMAAILRDEAALFVDGRYTLQAQEQVKGSPFALHHLMDDPFEPWLASRVGRGERIGFDPWLHTPDGVRRLRDALDKAGAEAVPLANNPIDRLWDDRPAPPQSPVRFLPETISGKSSADKRRTVAVTLREDHVQAVVLSAPDSVCWLLNIRGDDVPYTPFVLAFALLYADERVEVFLDPSRLPDPLDTGVRALPPAAFGPALDALAGRRVRLDYASAPEWVRARLAAAGAEPVRGDDPCLLPKACKNPVELAGMRAAHVRDGVALVRFLSWLDGREGVSELDVAAKLEAFRAESEGFLGLSFPTIAGSGPHGAIVHYKATAKSNRVLRSGEVLLIDSGGQYQEGTTDVTRTVVLGPPTVEMRTRFTQVLKGHIALSRAVFPQGTAGQQLDALARGALWADGVDYDHGTGHGVGHALSVHEGPQRIAKRNGGAELKPGMILSIEPGYYKPDAFGIRLENLVEVISLPTPEGAERPLLGFSPLTLAPFARALIDPARLKGEEMAWLNAYHAGVFATLSPLLGEDERTWLDMACARVG